MSSGFLVTGVAEYLGEYHCAERQNRCHRDPVRGGHPCKRETCGLMKECGLHTDT